MATIDSLNKSITKMSLKSLHEHLSAIRSQRRLRPARKESSLKQKSTPAKVARKADKKNLKQQDVFQYTQGLSEGAKSDLAAMLLKEMLK